MSNNNLPPEPPLAYENKEFLNSSDGRLLRILSEYEEPLARFRHENVQDTVVFFGSARFHSQEECEKRLAAARAAVAAAPDSAEAKAKLLTAERILPMARYYEDARKLAHLLTEWSLSLNSKRQRFVVTTGGGPGIMEAANRGAHEAGGPTIGLNISLPFEQHPNPYITPRLCFDFHYFFMRKLWFAYLAKALIVFPGGFGTFDEMFELMTLAQTRKLAKKMSILVYGEEYWRKCVNVEALAETGAISPEDVHMMRFVNTPEEAFAILKEELTRDHLQQPSPVNGPELARTAR